MSTSQSFIPSGSLYPLMLVASLLVLPVTAQEAVNSTHSEPPSASANNACAVEKEGEYNLPLHIGAVFILMGTSFLGTTIPLLGRYFFKRFSTRSLTFQALKLFSTGVIICTAFIHMFLPATKLLADKCLPAGFTDNYEAWTGVFAISGLFITHLIQVLIRRVTFNYARHHPEHHHSPSPKPTSTATASPDSIEPSPHQTEDDDGHGHGHHIEYQMIKERHSTVYVLELGVASHSLIIGVILGFARGAEFTALLVALCFHQFFEGTALSSVVVGARFSSLAPIALMVAMYSLSTPVGVALGVALESAASATLDLAAQNLTTGILEAFGAGILLYDALVNIVATHFAPPVKASETTAAVRASVGSETNSEQTSAGSYVPMSAAVQPDAGAVVEDKSLAKKAEKRLLRSDEEDDAPVSFVESSTLSQAVQIGAMWLGALVMAIIGKWA
ncbi:ZIP zinc transporter-domain-containing protein [Cladochytrium replicatum]|nr:ZIP zinc transporter-domain-containing protein [Cladochytrium replicatum]